MSGGAWSQTGHELRTPGYESMSGYIVCLSRRKLTPTALHCRYIRTSDAKGSSGCDAEGRDKTLISGEPGVRTGWLILLVSVFLFPSCTHGNISRLIVMTCR